jgi:hypothetical protein
VRHHRHTVGRGAARIARYHRERQKQCPISIRKGVDECLCSMKQVGVTMLYHLCKCPASSRYLPHVSPPAFLSCCAFLVSIKTRAFEVLYTYRSKCSQACASSLLCVYWRPPRWPLLEALSMWAKSCQSSGHGPLQLPEHFMSPSLRKELLHLSQRPRPKVRDSMLGSRIRN